MNRLDLALNDFRVSELEAPTRLNGGTVTIWLSKEDKRRYEELQRATRRQFGKKVRELLISAMGVTETSLKK